MARAAVSPVAVRHLLLWHSVRHMPVLCLTKLFLLAFVISFLVSGSLSTKMVAESAPNKPEFKRLPGNVIPSHYALSFEPDLVNFTFTGTELVTIDIRQATDTIVLNGDDLKVSGAAFEAANGSRIASKNVAINQEEQLITITFGEELKPGKGTLHLLFEGILNDKMKGFYRAKYPATDGSSADRYIATTKFEPTYARGAFPCWDEPAIKATFKITLIAPRGLLAISNMPITTQSTREDGKSVTVFEDSPIMSTYLLAFIVGEFDFVETTSKGGVKVRVYTRPGQKEQGNFSLDLTARSLDYYSEYFNIPYPLPKMDVVPVSDFASGAMENWGVITGRETSFLYDEGNTAAAMKQRIAVVVSHEVAHMWFGNLVTMEWWTHLWLNEGFATFMEYLCTEKLMPELNVMAQLVTMDLFSALELDSLKSSHPVEVPINNPSEIAQVFDRISYSKGSCIIAMLHAYIGDELFRKGLSLYLERFKYKNAETADLWTALAEASNKPIGEVMSTWTKQKGFPVISVSERQDGDTRILQLSQEKFTADGSASDQEKDYLWMVPISITCASSPNKPVAETLLSSRSSEFVVPNIKPGEWIKLNPNFVGVYRVQYSERMLQALLPAIPLKTLPPLDRVNILSDIFALAYSGRLPTVQALKVIEAFKDEEEYVVWSTLTPCLATLRTLISHTDFDEAYKVWARTLMGPIKSKVGWDQKSGESHTDSLLRNIILGLLSSFDDPSVLAESKRLFEAHANKSLVIPADIRSIVFNSAAQQADDKMFSTMVRLLKETDSSDEKNKLSGALGRVRDAALIERALNFSLSDDIRSQDIIYPLFGLTTHKLGRQAAWRFYKEKLSVFKERYGTTNFHASIIKRLLESNADESLADEIVSFFASNQVGLQMPVDQAVESIRLNAAWLARDREALKSFFNAVTQ